MLVEPPTVRLVGATDALVVKLAPAGVAVGTGVAVGAGVGVGVGDVPPGASAVIAFAHSSRILELPAAFGWSRSVPTQYVCGPPL